MRALVVGLGSMGKRRVRNLIALGVTDIMGYDPRADRRAEAVAKYGITALERVEDALEAGAPTVMVISTPPQHHMTYARFAFDSGVPCFIEASVVDAEGILELSHRAGDRFVIAPSCTMRYFPGPRQVKALLDTGAIGRPLHVRYHVGQYLPDWHPWEPIGDYYVSMRETGGAREIVPFELTWLTPLLAKPGTDPVPLACAKHKVTDMPADIDDVYDCLLSYPESAVLNLTVDVVSRPQATREMRIMGSDGLLVLSGDENCVRYSTLDHPDWRRIDLGSGTVESGYINPEEPYIAEVRDFLAAVTAGSPALFPNSLMDDWKILQTLHELEALSERQ